MGVIPSPSPVPRVFVWFKNDTNSTWLHAHLVFLLCIISQFRINVDGDERILVSVADFKVSAPVSTHLHLFSCASASLLLSGNDVTVRATGQTGVQRGVQSPEGKQETVLN